MEDDKENLVRHIKEDMKRLGLSERCTSRNKLDCEALACYVTPPKLFLLFYFSKLHRKRKTFFLKHKESFWPGRSTLDQFLDSWRKCTKNLAKKL